MSRGEDRRQAREAGSDMNKFYYLFGAVAAIGIGVVGYNVSAGMFGSAVSAPIELDLENDEALVAMAQGVSKGDENAPATIIEFGDYQCPGCGSFALNVKPQVEQMMVNTGQAKFVFYDYPLITIHPNAFLAARASRCAGEQDKYWEYHETLFRNQGRWSGASMPSSAFEGYADDVGIDSGEFASCLNSDRFADVITANMELAARMGVTGTPTVLIEHNGQIRRLNSFDYQTMQAAVDELTGANQPGSN